MCVCMCLDTGIYIYIECRWIDKPASQFLCGLRVLFCWMQLRDGAASLCASVLPVKVSKVSRFGRRPPGNSCSEFSGCFWLLVVPRSRWAELATAHRDAQRRDTQQSLFLSSPWTSETLCLRCAIILSPSSIKKEAITASTTLMLSLDTFLMHQHLIGISSLWSQLCT